MRNGNLERVFDAVSQGVSDESAIAIWLGIDKQAVTNACKRLVDAKRIRKDGRHWKKNTVPLLEEVWR